MANRTTEQRIADTIKRLESEPNVWIATASPTGAPHLVPLSLGWFEGMILVATPTGTPTARNVAATGLARASLESAGDVVIIEAEATAVSLAAFDGDFLDRFASRVGWDPRDESGDWSMLTLRPRMVLAWNSVGELKGRRIMHDGRWVTG